MVLHGLASSAEAVKVWSSTDRLVTFRQGSRVKATHGEQRLGAVRQSGRVPAGRSGIRLGAAVGARQRTVRCCSVCCVVARII